MAWGDFTWGSCQYDSAADFYKKVVGTKRTIGGKLAKKGITATWKRVRDWGEIKRLAVKYFEKHYFTNPDWTEDFWTPEEVKEKRNALLVVESIDGLFEYCKNMSWDLWCAAPRIAQWAFVDLKLHDVPKPTDVRGPIMNQVVQSDNYNVGVYCALLNAYFDVDEKSFKGFDT